MKAYIPTPNALTNVLAMQILKGDLEQVSTVEEADFLFVTRPEELRFYYREDKPFFFLVAQGFDKEILKKQPDNVLIVDGQKGLDHILGEVSKLKEIIAQIKPAIPKQPQDQTNIVPMSKSYFVLVVDDTEANLATAIARLPGQKLILARGPEEAMKYLNLPGEMPDAVLTDMQMRPDKLYGSLNVDQYGVTETIHSGFSVMFEATRRGIPVAIVTDGNHHQDWASAMFNHIKEQEVNGQKVLFFNNIGKRWDTALKMLLEPEPVQE